MGIFSRWSERSAAKQAAKETEAHLSQAITQADAGEQAQAAAYRELEMAQVAHNLACEDHAKANIELERAQLAQKNADDHHIATQRALDIKIANHARVSAEAEAARTEVQQTRDRLSLNNDSSDGQEELLGSAPYLARNSSRTSQGEASASRALQSAESLSSQNKDNTASPLDSPFHPQKVSEGGPAQQFYRSTQDTAGSPTTVAGQTGATRGGVTASGGGVGTGGSQFLETPPSAGTRGSLFVEKPPIEEDRNAVAATHNPSLLSTKQLETQPSASAYATPETGTTPLQSPTHTHQYAATAVPFGMAAAGAGMYSMPCEKDECDPPARPARSTPSPKPKPPVRPRSPGSHTHQYAAPAVPFGMAAAGAGMYSLPCENDCDPPNQSQPQARSGGATNGVLANNGIATYPDVPATAETWTREHKPLPAASTGPDITPPTAALSDNSPPRANDVDTARASTLGSDRSLAKALRRAPRNHASLTKADDPAPNHPTRKSVGSVGSFPAAFAGAYGHRDSDAVILPEGGVAAQREAELAHGQGQTVSGAPMVSSPALLPADQARSKWHIKPGAKRLSAQSQKSAASGASGASADGSLGETKGQSRATHRQYSGGYQVLTSNTLDYQEAEQGAFDGKKGYPEADVGSGSAVEASGWKRSGSGSRDQVGGGGVVGVGGTTQDTGDVDRPVPAKQTSMPGTFQ